MERLSTSPRSFTIFPSGGRVRSMYVQYVVASNTADSASPRAYAVQNGPLPLLERCPGAVD